MTWENKRLPVRYRDANGLDVFDRFLTDEQLREWDAKVDAMPMDDESKSAAKRTLRRMQGLGDFEGAVDPAVFEALRRLVREMA